MIRTIGILLALVGLIFVGMSGTKRRAPTNSRLPVGLGLIAIGLLIALFATQTALMLGLERP